MEDRPVKLSKRPGTDDSGKLYEFKITALLALRCVENPNIKHAWFGSNLNRLSDLDDVVVYVKDQNNVCTAYLMQLKHQDSPKNIQKNDFLYDAKLKKKSYMGEDFSVPRYHRNYFEVKESLDRADDDDSFLTSLHNADEIFYVIYTNRPLGKKLDFLEVCGDESTKLVGISTGGLNIYGLNPKMFEFDEYFLRNFKVFTEQAHITEVDELIKKELVRIAQSVRIEPVDVNVVLKKYLDFAQTSIRGVKTGFYEALTVNDVVKQLMSFYLSDYQVKFSLRRGHQFSLWDEIVKTKAFVVVEKIANNFVENYVSAKIKEHYNLDNWNQQVSKNSVYKKAPYLKPVLVKTVGDGGLTSRNVYEALWLLEKVPLLVKAITSHDFKRIQAALRLSRNNTHPPIIVLADANVAASSNLNDLSDDQQKTILRHEITLQGRPGVCLGDVLNKSMYKLVKFKDISNIILNKYNIGDSNLSALPYYIPRTISKVLFAWQDFSDIIDSKFILRGIDTVYFRTIFNSYDKNKAAVILGNETNNEHLKDYHELNYINKNIFELNRSCDRTQKLREHQLIQPHTVDKLRSFELWTSFEETFHQNACVVNANPGMGKTEFFNHVALNAPTQFWVLRVTVNKHNKYYKSLKNTNKSALDHLHYFHGDPDQELTKQVFLKFVKQKKVLVLLDGFDEILMTYKKEVTVIVTSLYESGYKVWVSTRPVTKAHLEEALDTISRTLNPLVIEDQSKFLNQYYEHLASDEDQKRTVREFVKKLLSAAAINLSDTDNQFTGLPLQTQLLADVFKKDLEAILHSNNCFAFNDKFDLIYLYESFLEEKNNILYRKSGEILMDMKESFEEFQKLCALSVVFGKDVLEKLHVKNELNECCSFFSKMHLLGREGIVSMDPTISFVHQTFAEFLAAKWLYQNWKTKDVREMIASRFKMDRDFLFNVFDRFAVENLPLHLSIVSRNKNETIKLIKQNSECVKELDNCGRTALHLLSCYGFRYKGRVSSAVDEMANVFDVIPNNAVTDSKDQLLGYNALEYAFCCKTFGIANKLCQKTEKLPFSLDWNKKRSVFEISKKNGYRYLFVRVCKYFARKELLCKRTKPLTSIFSFCGATINCDEYITKYKSKTVLELVRNTYGDDIGFVAAFGNSDEFLSLLENGVDVNETDSDANTALHYACISNNFQNSKALIDFKNTNVNLQNKDGDTPLHLSLEHQSFETAQALLEKNADVNLPNQLGETAFHYSCKYANATLVEKILPMVTHLQNKDGESGLHLALKKQNFDVAHALIKSRADVNLINNGNATPFLYASEYGNIDLVQTILPSVTNTNLQNKNGETPLFVSLKSQKIDIADFLIDKGVDVNLPNDFGTTSFAYASKVAHIDVVKKMLPTVKNINSQNRHGETALFLSLENEQTDISHALIEAGSDVNIPDGNGKTPFIYACKLGKIDLVHRLLPLIENINLQDDVGDTALHLSLEHKHFDLSLELIDQGADVNLINKFGQTPFLQALQYGKTDFILDLLPSVTDVNLQTWNGATALYLSITERKLDVAYKLIDHGANANLTDVYGHNALLYACEYGEIALAQKLLPTVTNINWQNCSGQTALLLALKQKHFDVALNLISAGVDVNLSTKKGATALHYLCKFQKLDLVKKILPMVTNVNVQNVAGESALNLSLKQKKHLFSPTEVNLDVAHLLVDAGADVNLLNSSGETVLFDACRSENLDFIKKILPTIKNINVQNVVGDTTLHVSLEAENFNIAHTLIDHGADVNLINHVGKSALFYVCQCGKIEFVKKILPTVTNVNLQNSDGDTALHLSLARKYFDVAHALIKVGAEINLANAHNTTPFFYLCKFQKIDFVKNILPTITNINLQNVEGETALHRSLKRAKKFDVAHILIDAGGDVNLIDNSGETVLFYACQCKQLDVVKKIVPMVSDINLRNVVGETALHLSVTNYNYDVACFLMNQGADVNLINNFGMNAFHYACQFGKVDLVKKMLPMTSNINSQNVDKDSALHLSLKKIGDVISVDVASFLIDEGADGSLVNNVGALAFFYACQSKNLDLVKKMLPMVSNINLSDSNGETALHYCLKGKFFQYGALVSQDGTVLNQRDYDIAHILIDAGADVNLVNNVGASPLFYACHFKKSDFAQEVLPMMTHIFQQNVDGEPGLYVSVPNFNLDVVYALTANRPDLFLDNDAVSRTARNFGIHLQIVETAEIENVQLTKVEGEIEFKPRYEFILHMSNPQSPTDYMDYLHLKIILYLKFVLERSINRKLRLAYVRAISDVNPKY